MLVAILLPLVACLPGAEEPQPLPPFEAALVASLVRFAEDGNVDHVRAIIEKYPKLIDQAEQFRQPRKPTRVDQHAALHFAAENGREEVVELLLSKGANVNVSDGFGRTPLHLAAAEGHLEVVKMLVKANAKRDAKTTPIKGYFGVAPSSSPDARPQQFPDIPAQTALDFARDRNRKDVVDYLESLK